MTFKKAIHLLYAPTEYCNMSCRYCYLGTLTERQSESEKALRTLEFALDKLLAAGYLPFNLSFHGGEATTLAPALLDGLFALAARHYGNYAEQIKSLGFRVNPPHIKTNLLNFNKHYDTFVKYGVSISGSVDLPLTLHDRFRRDKKGGSTLARIEANLRLLAAYPYNKKISCVVTREHLQCLDAFVEDIKLLHYEIGLDMSRFNVMFGFDAPENATKFGGRPSGTEMLDGAEQVAFYRRLQQAFAGTVLDNALRNEWFKEFTAEFCCSAVNCGNKFFLLQANGDVYSCPRGQASAAYRYGNIFTDAVADIIDNGWKTIERNENRMTLAAECLNCVYLPYCNIGCTFVRSETGLRKSYTCLLQKELYRDNPDRYRPLSPLGVERYAKQFLLRNNLQQLSTGHAVKTAPLTPELFSPDNRLDALVRNDPLLCELYSETLFFLRVNGTHYALRSAILKNERDLECLDVRSSVVLGVRADALDLACDYPVNNALHLMLLRDTAVVYGDEQRSKQQHICDYSLYRDALQAAARREGDYFLLDITAVLHGHAEQYRHGVRNNLFVTTKALRDYHYDKHKKNAFYHVQAINLPFQNIEFLWQSREEPT
ncbi:MAG: radical SAM protein [Gammaproteobacteria bacterium]